MKWVYESKELEGYICDIDPTWEEALQELLSDYHETFSKLFADSGVAVANIDEELIPLMFVVSQIALHNSNCKNTDSDTLSLLNIFFDWIGKMEFKSDILKTFDERLHLYVDVIRNDKEPRYEWLMFNKPEGATDIISRCHAVFGDILFNPACANDYENAPVMVHSVFSVVDFRPKMVDFYFLVIEFCHKVVSTYNIFNPTYTAQPQRNNQEPKQKLSSPPFMAIIWIILFSLVGFSLLLLALNL